MKVMASNPGYPLKSTIRRQTLAELFLQVTDLSPVAAEICLFIIIQRISNCCILTNKSQRVRACLRTSADTSKNVPEQDLSYINEMKWMSIFLKK